MNRLLMAAVLTVSALSAASAHGQSWMLQPSTYSDTYGPKSPNTAVKPHAYATFTESQAAAAAKLPKPAFQWDPTGILGRGRKFDMWNHQATMEANRLRTYAHGVRDAVGAPVWTWQGPAPQQTPQIVAPTATSPGKTKSRP